MLPRRGEIWLVNLDPIYEKLLVRLQLLLSIKNRSMKPDFNLRSIVTPESIELLARSHSIEVIGEIRSIGSPQQWQRSS